MSEIPNISRLARYPELLRYKKESEQREERRREKREDGWDKYSEMIKDEVTLTTSDSVTDTILESRRKQQPAPKKDEKKRPGVGDNIDLFV